MFFSVAFDTLDIEADKESEEIVLRNLLEVLTSFDLDDEIEELLIEPTVSEPPKKKRKLNPGSKEFEIIKNRKVLYLSKFLPTQE